jgi:hypothetical protein
VSYPLVPYNYTHPIHELAGPKGLIGCFHNPYKNADLVESIQEIFSPKWFHGALSMISSSLPPHKSL